MNKPVTKYHQNCMYVTELIARMKVLSTVDSIKQCMFTVLVSFYFLFLYHIDKAHPIIDSKKESTIYRDRTKQFD